MTILTHRASDPERIARLERERIEDWRGIMQDQDVLRMMLGAWAVRVWEWIKERYEKVA